MTIVQEIKKLEASDVAIGVGLFVAIICPGFLTLYLYKPNLVWELDALKLIVFSCALMLPILVVNFFLYSSVLSQIDPGWGKAVKAKYLFFWQLLWLFIISYFSLAIAYLFQIVFRKFVLTLVLADIVVFVFVLVFLYKSHKAEQSAQGQRPR